MHAAMRPKAAQQAQDVTVRAIEQGARLVACPASGLRAVLQMPRGNLEGICPRVLVLAGIAADLQVIIRLKPLILPICCLNTCGHSVSYPRPCGQA